MSHPERTEDTVTRSLRELGNAAVPVEDAQRAAYRRERLVRAAQELRRARRLLVVDVTG